MLKKTIIALLTVTALICSTEQIIATDFIGNNSSLKFHYSNCRVGKKIKADHQVNFNSREEAINAGYTPCKICNP